MMLKIYRRLQRLPQTCTQEIRTTINFPIYNLQLPFCKKKERSLQVSERKHFNNDLGQTKLSSIFKINTTCITPSSTELLNRLYKRRAKHVKYY